MNNELVIGHDFTDFTMLYACQTQLSQVLHPPKAIYIGQNSGKFRSKNIIVFKFRFIVKVIY